MIQTRQLFQSATGSPLGRITLAGTIHDSRGVAAKSMRIFGSYAVVYLLGGGGWHSNLERYGNQSDMWVDYVRVYQGAK